MSTVEAPVPDGRTRRSPVGFGPFVFDPQNGLLKKDGRELPLPPRVLGVLGLLLERAGDLVPRQQIIERVWKDAFVTDTSLAEAVSGLRQALGDDPQSPTYVQTVHRRGYRFVAPIETLAPPAPPPLPPARVPDPVTVAVPTLPEPPVSPSIGGALVPWSLAALFAVLASVAVWQVTTRPELVPAETRFTVGLSAAATYETSGSAVAFSPDGTRAVWAACAADGCRLYLRPLSQLDGEPLAGTDHASSPFFSPDGLSIAFFADGRLKRVALSGGAPVTIADVTLPRGGAWTNDGRIVFGSGFAGGLWQVPAQGGTPQLLTLPNEQDGEVRHAWPSVTADGRTLIFTIDTTLEEDAPGRLALASLDGARLITQWATVLQNVRNARLLSPDIIVVARGNELQAVSLDPQRRVLAGVPQSLISQVASAGGAVQFATSGTGSVIYVAQGAAGAGGLAWWTPGGETPLPAALAPSGPVAIAADGRQLAWTASVDSARTDVWIGDVERAASARLTHDERNTSPVWTPDGRIVFAHAGDGRFGVASSAPGGGPVTTLAGSDHHLFPTAISRDGRTVALVSTGGETRADIWLMDVAGGQPKPLEHSPFDEVSPALSTDGSLAAYQSDEGGRWDVYVVRAADNKRAVLSTAGGERPFWSADGHSVFYEAAGALWRATVAADLAIGQPVKTLDLNGRMARGQDRDGRILLQQRRSAGGTSAVVALHWDREARAALGPRTTAMPR